MATTQVKQMTSMKRPISGNPFYQMAQTLRMFQELPKVDDDTVTKNTVFGFLTAAWLECKTSREKRELFMCLLFAIGDISNREHNIFRHVGIKDVENGGLSKRRTFVFCLEWLLANVPDQFYKFLPIIGEYYNLDGTMLYELRTDRYKGTLKEILRLPIDIEKVTSYIASVIGNTKVGDNEKFLWAKWLPHIPSSKRVRKYVMTDKNVKAFQKKNPDVQLGQTIKVSKDKKEHTQTKDEWVRNFIYALSKKLGWKVIAHKHNTEYKGYRDFKKKYLAETEATMFSTKKVKELDKTQFFAWLDKLPSGARFNVQRKLLEQSKTGKQLSSRKKWINNYGNDLGELYLEWIKSKEVAQQTVRNMTPGQLAEMAPVEKKELLKAAKVNTGAETLLDIVAKLLNNKTDLANIDIIAHSLLEKMNIQVPVLVCADISGSMSSGGVVHKGLRFTAQSMAQLATTVFLLKNPKEDLSDMFIRFDDVSEVICANEKVTASGRNRFLATSAQKVSWLTDRTKKFSDNLVNVSQYIIARNATQFNQVALSLKHWVDAEPAFSEQRKEHINQYPVFLVISDGDFNSHSTPASSLQDFQQKMRQYFGWEGVVCIWDVAQMDIKTNKFDGLDNVMYFGGCNMGILNQVFTKINDLDIIDVYLPLKTTAETKRYSPVRSLTI